MNRPRIMGILNVTPDSFSDGGLHSAEAEAVSRALEMVGEGADIVDVGGESTRPYSTRVSGAVQIARVVGVIRRLREEVPADVSISIDTTLSRVAEAALDAGADFINDISAGRDDADLLRLAAERGAPVVLMHMQGTPETMQDDPQYGDVVVEVHDFLVERAEAAQKLGVRPENIVLDPGIGFGKTREHNLALLANLPVFVRTGYPVLLGSSRKRFMGALCREAEPRQLVGATCATTALGVVAGVAIFRVHDVRPNRQAAEVAWALHTRSEARTP